MAMLLSRAPIENYLSAVWPEPGVPLVFENGPPIAPDLQSWLLIEVYGRSYQQKSIGSGEPNLEFWREEGVLTAHVLVPVGTGAREASRLAQIFVLSLRGVVIEGNIKFLDATVGAGDPGDERGKYWRLTAKIDWERD